MTGSSFRVLVAGGGVAGLEALLALRDLAGGRAELTLLSPDPEFVYRPMAVAEPFARGRAARHPLRDIERDLGVELIGGALTEIDGASRTVRAAAGSRLSYDALLVTVGARSEPACDRGSRGHRSMTPSSSPACCKTSRRGTPSASPSSCRRVSPGRCRPMSWRS